MNKKQNPEEVLNKNITIRYTAAEYLLLKKKIAQSNISLSEYCRRMTLEGYIQAASNPHDMNEVRELKKILLEYKTNFSRISNMVKASDPYLNIEILKTRDSLQAVIEKIQL